MMIARVFPLIIFFFLFALAAPLFAQTGATARNQGGDSARASDDSTYVEIPPDKPPETYFSIHYNPGTPIADTPGWYDVKDGDDFLSDFKREFKATFQNVEMEMPMAFSVERKAPQPPFPDPVFEINGAVEMDSIEGKSPNLPYIAWYLTDRVTDATVVTALDHLQKYIKHPAPHLDSRCRWSLGAISELNPVAISSSLLFKLPNQDATPDTKYAIIAPMGEGGDYLSSTDPNTHKPIYNPDLRAIYLHKPDKIKIQLSWTPQNAMKVWHTPFKARTDHDKYYENGEIQNGHDFVYKDGDNPVFVEMIQPQKVKLKWGIGQKYHAIDVIPIDMAVDANRDGIVKFAGNWNDQNVADKPLDKTKKSKPFQVWINSDNDGSGDGTENIGGAADSNDSEIKSKRDLEDFFRLHLYFGGLQSSIASGACTIGLKWKSVTGNPSIKIYEAVEMDGGTAYLSDDATAASQIGGTYKTAKATVAGMNTTMLPATLFSGLSANTPNVHLLFEAAGEGKGRLVMTIHKGGIEIGEGPGVWIELKDITKMYERGYSNPINMIVPFDRAANFDIETASVSTTGATFQKPDDETSQCIIYVHGWNTDIPGFEANSAIMFKRLWHRGFKGRFAGFRWDTMMGGALDFESFHVSEWRGYKFGKSLQDYVTNLKSRLPGYSINVIAHSLGSAALTSALIRGAQIDNCVYTQGALAAHVFDPNAPLRAGSFTTPDLATDGGYRGWLTPSAVNITSFFNSGDVVLFGWQTYQNGKPHNATGPGQYKYTAATGKRWIEYSSGPLPTRDVFDNHESMAFVAIGRTAAVGAEGATGGAVDLNFNLGVGGLIYGNEHSPQLDRHIQKNTLPYYNEMLTRFKITPNP